MMSDEESSQGPARKPRRFWRWFFYLAALIVIVGAALYFTGHLPGVGGKGGSTATTLAPPVGSGYLATTPSSVIFIQWNQTGTATAGVAHIANVEGQPPSQTIAVKTTTATGQINGSDVYVDLQGVTQAFGRTEGGGFILDFPQPDGSLASVTFRKASAQDYNNALAALRAGVKSVNPAASSTTSSTATRN
jgi:hypothetical protein